MVHKKKYHGGYLAFFLLCCVFFFGNISNSFARTTLTDDEAEYLWNYFFNNTYSSDISNIAFRNLRVASWVNDNPREYFNYDGNFKSYFNSTNTLDIGENTYFFTIWYADYSMVVCWFNVHNTASSDNLPYLYLHFGSNDTLTIYGLDDNHNFVPLSGRKIEITNLYFNPNFTNADNYDISTTGKTLYLTSNSNWNTNNSDFATILNPLAGFTNLARLPVSIVYSNYNGHSYTNAPISYFYKSLYVPPEPEPETPSGENGLGNITTPSGENGGNINLQPIQEGLTNIQNQISGDSQRIIDNQNENTQSIVNTISGEVSKITNTLTDSADSTIDNTVITSGDISSALNFEIASNPYDNFWFILTNNLKEALLGSKRSIDISFRGNTWTISLDDYLQLPAWLVIILTPISTSFLTWVLVRQWKLIFNKLSTGNVDSLLKDNSQERHF